MQYLVVALVVAAAVAYLAVRVYRSVTRKGWGGGSRCDGCTLDCGLRDSLTRKDYGGSCENGR